MKKALICILLLAVLPFSKAQTVGNADLQIKAYGLYYKGDFPQAKNAFEQLKSEATDLNEILLIYGICSFYMSDFDDAERSFNSAIQKGNVPALIWQARTMAAKGKNPESIALLKRYLQNDFLVDFKNVRKDSLLRNLQKSAEWITFIESDWQSETGKLVEDSRYYLSRQDYEKAIESIDKALEIEESNISLFSLKSNILASMGDTALAIDELNKAISLDPLNALLLLNKCDLLISQLKYQEVRTILNEMLINNPGDFKARYLRSATNMSLGNFQQAKADIDLYNLYLTSDSAAFLTSRITFHLGRYKETLELINPLIEKDKSKAAYFRIRGITYYHTQIYQQAAYDLSMSLDLDPDNAEANYFLGLTQKTLGNKKLADYYLNRAIKYGDKRASEFLDIPK